MPELNDWLIDEAAQLGYRQAGTSTVHQSILSCVRCCHLCCLALPLSICSWTRSPSSPGAHCYIDRGNSDHVKQPTNSINTWHTRPFNEKLLLNLGGLARHAPSLHPHRTSSQHWIYLRTRPSWRKHDVRRTQLSCFTSTQVYLSLVSLSLIQSSIK